jgi:hypothetical protein
VLQHLFKHRRRVPVANLDSAEASFVAERELLGMRDKSIPKAERA